MFKDYPDIMNAEELKEALGLGKNMVYLLLKTNQIKHFRIGINYKIPKLCVVNYVKQQIEEDLNPKTL